jgi:hypothetical protein
MAKRTATREKTIKEVRDFLAGKPEFNINDVMDITKEEFMNLMNKEAILESAHRAFTRRILRAVKDDQNICEVVSLKPSKGTFINLAEDAVPTKDVIIVSEKVKSNIDSRKPLSNKLSKRAGFKDL